MSRIFISVNDVISSGSKASLAKSTVSEVKSSLDSLKSQMDLRVLSRNSLGVGFSSVSSQLSSIQSRIENIQSVIENGANGYYNADKLIANSCKVIADENAGKLSSLFILNILSGGNSKAKAALKDSGENSQSLGTAATSGTTVSATGDVLTAAEKKSNVYKWDLDKGDAVIEKSYENEYNLLKGTVSGTAGIFSISASGTVGTFSSKGEFGASLFKDGKLSPSLTLALKAKGSVLEGKFNATVGEDDLSFSVAGNGSVLTADVEGNIGVGDVKVKDPITGEEKTETGISERLALEAYLLKGSVWGEFNVLGVKIRVGVTGKLGGAGVVVDNTFTTGGLRGELGAGFLGGGSVKYDIDWSDFDWSNVDWSDFDLSNVDWKYILSPTTPINSLKSLFH